MEDHEFVSCYRCLISHYRLASEESSIILAEILRRIDSLNWKARGREKNHNSGGNRHGGQAIGTQ